MRAEFVRQLLENGETGEKGLYVDPLTTSCKLQGGWTDSHLHQFEAKGQLYEKPSGELSLPVKSELASVSIKSRCARRTQCCTSAILETAGLIRSSMKKSLLQRPRLSTRCVAGARASPPEFGDAEFPEGLEDSSARNAWTCWSRSEL